MTKTINIKRLANLLSADNELDDIERCLKRNGQRRAARKVAGVREMLARALNEEQACLYDALLDPR
jgi:hypothetical protein